MKSLAQLTHLYSQRKICALLIIVIYLFKEKKKNCKAAVSPPASHNLPSNGAYWINSGKTTVAN